jgi:GT2 family glycosyltransferase
MSPQHIAKALTIVIPTLGRDCLRDSVRAIASGSMRPAEIVLSHQGIPGSMDSMLREFSELGVSIRYVHSDKRGCAAGRNTGIQHVTTEYFATTDDDCIATSSWIAAIAAALDRNPGEIATGRVLASEPGAPSVVTSGESRVFRRVPLKGDHFTGGNFATSLAIFRDIGPFDETELIRFCEDNEWSFRALAKGYVIRYLPQITVTHLHWRDNVEMAQVYSQYAVSQGGWYGRKLRHGDGSFVIRLLYDLMRGSKRWCLGALGGNYLRKVHGRAFVVDLLRGVAAGWNER